MLRSGFEPPTLLSKGQDCTTEPYWAGEIKSYKIIWNHIKSEPRLQWLGSGKKIGSQMLKKALNLAIV